MHHKSCVRSCANSLSHTNLFLKGNAQAWFKDYEEKLQRVDPPTPLNLDNLKQALKEEFVKEEDPKKVWQDVQETIQKEKEPVGE